MDRAFHCSSFNSFAIQQVEFSARPACLLAIACATHALHTLYSTNRWLHFLDPVKHTSVLSARCGWQRQFLPGIFVMHAYLSTSYVHLWKTCPQQVTQTYFSVHGWDRKYYWTLKKTQKEKRFFYKLMLIDLRLHYLCTVQLNDIG